MKTSVTTALVLLLFSASASAAADGESLKPRKRAAPSSWSAVDLGVTTWREDMTYGSPTGNVPVRLLAYGPMLAYSYYVPLQRWSWAFGAAGFIGDTNARGESTTTVYQTRGTRTIGAFITASALRNLDAGVRIGASVQALARSMKFDTSDPDFSLQDNTRVLPVGSLELQWNFYEDYTLLQRLGLGAGLEGTIWQLLLSYRL